MAGWGGRPWGEAGGCSPGAREGLEAAPGHSPTDGPGCCPLLSQEDMVPRGSARASALPPGWCRGWSPHGSPGRWGSSPSPAAGSSLLLLPRLRAQVLIWHQAHTKPRASGGAGHILPRPRPAVEHSLSGQETEALGKALGQGQGPTSGSPRGCELTFSDPQQALSVGDHIPPPSGPGVGCVAVPLIGGTLRPRHINRVDSRLLSG